MSEQTSFNGQHTCFLISGSFSGFDLLFFGFSVIFIVSWNDFNDSTRVLYLATVLRGLDTDLGLIKLPCSTISLNCSKVGEVLRMYVYWLIVI